MKVKLEFTLPDKYLGTDLEMFAAMVSGSIWDSKHLKRDAKKCIVDNGIRVISERDEMLDNLAYYSANDPGDLPAILDKLLAYKGDSNDLEEICPEFCPWEQVEFWDYKTLMGAIR